MYPHILLHLLQYLVEIPALTVVLLPLSARDLIQQLQRIHAIIQRIIIHAGNAWKERQ